MHALKLLWPLSSLTLEILDKGSTDDSKEKAKQKVGKR